MQLQPWVTYASQYRRLARATFLDEGPLCAAVIHLSRGAPVGPVDELWSALNSANRRYHFGLRRSSRSSRSDHGSPPLDVPAFEMSSNCSRFELASHSGRPGPFGSPVFAKLVQ